MAGRQREHGKALRKRFFSPADELRRRLLVALEELAEQMLGLVLIRRLEDRAGIGGDSSAHRHFRHVGSRILLQMELAALPGHAREHSLPGGLQALVAVTDDQLETV